MSPAFTQRISALLLAFFSLPAFAKVSVLFHPYDPALHKIAQHIEEAQSTIDIAMYNMDVTLENPIMQTISSEAVQARLNSGELSIRILFEGYGTKHSFPVMTQLEELGVDARYLTSSKKIHHKFAAIDSEMSSPVVITGSANWSLSSQNNYNENVLFFENEAHVSQDFQKEFDMLWSIAKEFGQSKERRLPVKFAATSESLEDSSLQTYFNTDNFFLNGQTLKNDDKGEGYTLTRQIVELIDGAESHIEIATTRIRLRPIYEALLRAAKRGIDIHIVVTMGEYESLLYREGQNIELCADVFDPECSKNQNFAVHLARPEFQGHENVHIRFKYFNLDLSSYLSKQMHSKYILVDDNKLITGSFNWSYSAEYNHIENIVRIEGDRHFELMQRYAQDFEHLWTMNRGDYAQVSENLVKAIADGEHINCDLQPMSLSFDEIDVLVQSVYSLGVSIKDLCQPVPAL